MNPNAPPGWFFFVVMFVGTASAIGLIVVLGGLSRLARGESFWPREARERPSPARSNAQAWRVRRSRGVRAGSAPKNATLRHQDGTFAGSEGSRSGSEVRESSGAPAAMQPIAPDLPQSIEELGWALEAVRLRTSGAEPTKEAAIKRAFPHVQSKGAGSWQRASKLYDTVMQAQRATPASSVSSPHPTAETV
jgi:hypothetical protein